MALAVGPGQRGAGGWISCTERISAPFALMGEFIRPLGKSVKTEEKGSDVNLATHLPPPHSVRSVRLTETFQPQVPYLKETVLDR
jgi:hypothetical protein